MLQYSMDPGYTYAYMVHCLIQSSKIFPLLHQQNFIFTVDSWILPKAKLGEFSWLCHQHANSCSTLLMVCQSAQLGGVNNMNLTSLYNGASLSMGTSSWAIMLFSISNKLTYSAMAELLELIELHCPAPNSCIKSLYNLKKQFSQRSECQKFHYCSRCMTKLDTKAEGCSQRACTAARSPIAYFTLLPLDKNLQDLYTGR